jgi:hypothetical protein
VFNVIGQLVTLKSSSAAGVDQALRRYKAGGGTCYNEGVKALLRNKPSPDEDLLVIFVGDEGETYPERLADVFRENNLSPIAFGLLKVPGETGSVVRDAAKMLEIPCIEISEAMFEGQDPYAIPRILRHLIASTPVEAAVRRSVRKTLVEEIIQTPLLQKPTWAS